MVPYRVPVLIPEAMTIVAVAALVVASLALLIALVAWRRGRRSQAHYTALMTGVRGANLAAALESFSRRLAEAEVRVARFEGRCDDIDGRLRKAVQRVQLHRYNAFDGSGGDQSFALALLDDARDGVVITGLLGRSGMRAYAKPVTAGHSPHALTTEEERVLVEAGGVRRNG